MLSSGETAKSTNSDTAIDLISVDDKFGPERSCYILNRGTVDGFFSLDGGTTYAFLAASSAYGPLKIRGNPVHIKAKRVASGSDLTGLWAFTD